MFQSYLRSAVRNLIKDPVNKVDPISWTVIFYS